MGYSDRTVARFDDVAYIDHLVRKGGPDPADYPELCARLELAYAARLAGELSETDVAGIREALAPALCPETMQGFAYTKPHGYAGDFEIIDRIYTRYEARQPQLVKWDRFYHSQPAPRAVRNRKTYFHELLAAHTARKAPLRVLKIASGPGRSMYEFLNANPDAKLHIDCVELDGKAIDYARRLNARHLDRIAFHQQNALKFRPVGLYDLVWAAGIFDYFSDRVFVSLAQRLLRALASGAELVIGNFSESNPSRPYMELVGEWKLHHRSRANLKALALRAGASADRVRISSEPEGVNLFLHVHAACG